VFANVLHTRAIIETPEEAVFALAWLAGQMPQRLARKNPVHDFIVIDDAINLLAMQAQITAPMREIASLGRGGQHAFDHWYSVRRQGWLWRFGCRPERAPPSGVWDGERPRCCPCERLLRYRSGVAWQAQGRCLARHGAQDGQGAVAMVRDEDLGQTPRHDYLDFRWRNQIWPRSKCDKLVTGRSLVSIWTNEAEISGGFLAVCFGLWPQFRSARDCCLELNRLPAIRVFSSEVNGNDLKSEGLRTIMPFGTQTKRLQQAPSAQLPASSRLMIWMPACCCN
jgi:hypothetical protein